MAKLIWNRCPKHGMDMIRDYDDELKSFNKDETGPLCPQCKGNFLAPFEQDGWYCSRCKFRS